MSTLTISIDRTSLSLAALVLSGSVDANQLGMANYVEPAMQQRITYFPVSRRQHGSVMQSSAYDQTVLNFDVFTDLATTEAASRALIAELRAALNQSSYAVTVTVDGAMPEVWTCDPGSVGAVQRSYIDLKSHNAVYPVSIPCNPIRS